MDSPFSFARPAIRQILSPVQDAALRWEQRRGVLGLAHRRWRDNSASENRRRWSDYDWSGCGDEWNASPEWKQALIDDVLRRWIFRDGGGRVLEIGPGAGRWSEALLARASHLTLVDVSDTPLALCRQRFGDDPRISYVLSPGCDIPGVPDRSIDAVWSFDVFVHLAPQDQVGYLKEIARILVPGGVAVLHHADGRNRGELPSRSGWRSPMSRVLFATLVADHGLHVERQFSSWGPDDRYDLSAFADTITVCRGLSAHVGRD
jgi:ubiquinone/menaquinone biosynthesis C-methylase UbiE